MLLCPTHGSGRTRRSLHALPASGPALVAPVIPAETFAGVANNGVSASLAGGGFGAGTDTLAGIENLTGSGHNDRLTGDALANRLVGGGGDDLLKGLGGNDVLVAGAGSDTLVAGDGADTFVLGLPATPGERDRIIDFKPGDHIGIDADIFTQLGELLVPGLDPSDFFSIYPETVAIGPRATNEWEFLVFDPRTHRLYYDADGSGAGAQVEIATVLVTTLSADDFLLLA